MNTDRTKPDLTFVSLIHQALRADGARLLTTVEVLQPESRAGRLPLVREFYGNYREQLVAHHTHEDKIFFPALAARVGDDRMHREELSSQHEQLDGVLQAIEDGFAALIEPDRDFSAHRTAVVAGLSSMVEHLRTHLALEEETALALVVSEMSVSEYKKLESMARKATPQKQARFMIPWLAENASPDQRRAWFASAPPLRILYWLNRRRYRRLDDALRGESTRGS